MHPLVLPGTFAFGVSLKVRVPLLSSVLLFVCLLFEMHRERGNGDTSNAWGGSRLKFELGTQSGSPVYG